MNLHLLGPALLVACLASTGAGANTIGCGGDAFSSAEVVGARQSAKPGTARRGPVTAAPDTLCADLSEDRPAARPSFDVMIGGTGGQTGTGDAGQGAAPPPSPSSQRRRPGR
jgi:hypothetical protein